MSTATIVRSPADQVRAALANLEMAYVASRAQAERAIGKPTEDWGRYHNQAEGFRQAIALIQTECADLLGGQS